MQFIHQFVLATEILFSNATIDAISEHSLNRHIATYKQLLIDDGLYPYKDKNNTQDDPLDVCHTKLGKLTLVKRAYERHNFATDLKLETTVPLTTSVAQPDINNFADRLPLYREFLKEHTKRHDALENLSRTAAEIRQRPV